MANEFAKALKVNLTKRDGYNEGDDVIITWCVGHLVRLSYPDVYDEKYKSWRMEDIPFIPEQFKYEIIDTAAKQFKIVSGLLNRADVDTIYICTDSGREGEYIYRLVDQEAHVTGKVRKRVWINSQTEEEVLRGIKEAKDWSEYDNLSESAYLRAKEDYLIGINLTRALSGKYGYTFNKCFEKEKYQSVTVGRVMTCVLGMIVRRELEIRNFEKTPFYRVIGNGAFAVDGGKSIVPLEWKAVAGSKYFETPFLYKENGFKEKKTAEELIVLFTENGTKTAVGTIEAINKKKEKKNAPNLFNLAEAQATCSKLFKITPDETLTHIQSLYEKKMVTYPRTDARVLSTAVCKEITKNISGLKNISVVAPYAQKILDEGLYKGIEKNKKYCDDSKITDHYAIIPTGETSAIKSLSAIEAKVYETIVRRFLAVFYPPAEYEQVSLDVAIDKEHLFASQKYLVNQGYLEVMQYTFKKKTDANTSKAEQTGVGGTKSVNLESPNNGTIGEADDEDADNPDESLDSSIDFGKIISTIKKGDKIPFDSFEIKEGETSPPKRYNSGNMILAMENAGQLIENEELRAQIKGSGIGTSATRAEILKKLVDIKYINLNKKTQIYSPTIRGELIYYIVKGSVPALLDPKMTASWEKGLTQVAEGTITGDQYMEKLSTFVTDKTNMIKNVKNWNQVTDIYRQVSKYYK